MQSVTASSVKVAVMGRPMQPFEQQKGGSSSVKVYPPDKVRPAAHCWLQLCSTSLALTLYISSAALPVAHCFTLPCSSCNNSSRGWAADVQASAGFDGRWQTAADARWCPCAVWLSVTVRVALTWIWKLLLPMLQVALPPLTQKTVAGGADGAADFVYDRV